MKKLLWSQLHQPTSMCAKCYLYSCIKQWKLHVSSRTLHAGKCVWKSCSSSSPIIAHFTFTEARISVAGTVEAQIINCWHLKTCSLGMRFYQIRLWSASLRHWKEGPQQETEWIFLCECVRYMATFHHLETDQSEFLFTSVSLLTWALHVGYSLQRKGSK